jgi:hypothetical protein
MVLISEVVAKGSGSVYECEGKVNGCKDLLCFILPSNSFCLSGS